MPPRKKRSPDTVILAILFLVALGIGAYGIYAWWMVRKAGFAHYEGFGISLPNDYAIHGIDVSHHQSTISWDEVKKMKVKDVQLGFAVIKATEGVGFVDWHFSRNWRHAKKAGMPRGAYHFFNPNLSGKQQAEHFIRTVKLEKGDLPPVLDIEDARGARPGELAKRAMEFLRTVEAYYGVRPLIYTNVDFYKRSLGSAFDAYPLWVAHYIQRNSPRIDRNWVIWQHSERGRVNGITTAVDFNVFNGDSSSFNNLLIK